MEFVLIWLIFGVICAAIASSKGRSEVGWFVLGALFGPFALVFALFAPSKSKVDEEKLIDKGEMKRCPYCAELVKNEAVKCRYCRERL